MALEKPMYNPIAFSPVATLTSDIAVGSTVIPVSDVNAFPPAPSYATIGTDAGAETIRYTAKTADSLSGCIRGVEGVAQAWQTGEPIARNFTAEDHQAIIDNLLSLASELLQAYSPSNKPTASDVGALPISGGTLTGTNIYLDNGYGSVGADANTATLTSRNEKNSDATFRRLYLQNSVGGILNSALILRDTKPNTGNTYYSIYGEHNKSLLTENAKGLTLQSGVTGDCVYHKNADGAVCVEILGINASFTLNTNVTIGTLPAGYRPSGTRYAVLTNDSGNIFLLAILNNGTIQIKRLNGSSGTSVLYGHTSYKAVN